MPSTTTTSAEHHSPPSKDRFQRFLLAGPEGSQRLPPDHRLRGKRPDTPVLPLHALPRDVPQCIASIKELAAETCTTVGLTGSLDRSTKVKFTLACSTELRATLGRCVASPGPGQWPGRHPGEHLHSPSAAYGTELF